MGIIAFNELVPSRAGDKLPSGETFYRGAPSALTPYMPVHMKWGVVAFVSFLQSLAKPSTHLHISESPSMLLINTKPVYAA